jgi:hypothetical protein
MMKCIHCGKTPTEHGVTLLRQNPKGEVGVWACTACNKQPVESCEIVAIIEADNQKARH